MRQVLSSLIAVALRRMLMMVVLGGAAFASVTYATEQRHPNILLVMADQLVPHLTGPYGNREVKTPHMDRLAREGVVFTAAYSNCPLCAPARAALISGRYVSRTGSFDNGAALSCEVPTFAHHLRLAGDKTHRDVETRLREQLLQEFDPTAIDRAVRLSQKRRLLIREAMRTGKRTQWDYETPGS